MHPSRGYDGTGVRKTDDRTGRAGPCAQLYEHHADKAGTTIPGPVRSNCCATPRRRRRGPDRRDQTPDRGVLSGPIRPFNKGKHRPVHIRPLAHSDEPKTSARLRTIARRGDAPITKRRHAASDQPRVLLDIDGRSEARQFGGFPSKKEQTGDRTRRERRRSERVSKRSRGFPWAPLARRGALGTE